MYLKLKPGIALERVLVSIGNNKVRLSEKDYRFDKVFDEETSQTAIYTEAVSPLVRHVMDGYDSLFFTMGSSGSGKSYTVFGDAQEKGMIQMALETIFSEFKEVKIAMTEIYNDKVLDLLGSETPKPLMIKTMPETRKTYLAGLTKFSCTSIQDAYKVLEKGQKARACNSTGSNNMSSRSHAFTYIEVPTPSPGMLTIADLAGTERNKLSKTEGERFQESCAINQSLMLLGQCLKRGSTASVNEFRSCKLTHLLLANAFLAGSTQKNAMMVAADPYGDANSIAQIFRYSAAAMEIPIAREKYDTKLLRPSNAHPEQSRVSSTSSGSTLASFKNEQRVSDGHSGTDVEDVSQLQEEDYETEVEEETQVYDIHTPRSVLWARVAQLEAQLEASQQREQDIEDHLRAELYDDMESKLDELRNEFLDMRAAEAMSAQEHLDSKIQVAIEAVRGEYDVVCLTDHDFWIAEAKM